MKKTAQMFRDIVGRHPECAGISTFIETGTALATTTIEAAKVFPVVHSIELSPEYFERASSIYRGKAQFHFGDSAVILPELLKGMDYPVVILLDAHYCLGFGGMAAKATFPLWQELEVIRERPYADIVLVDDVHTFGKSRPSIRTSEGVEWEGVTFEAIRKTLDTSRILEALRVGDDYVIYRKPVNA